MSELAPPIAATPGSRPESERTCVGCRRRAPARALARLALRTDGDAGALIFWGRGRARPAGRGASLHRDASCLRAALKSGAFARAFRAKVAVGLEDEADLLQQLTGSEDRNS
jgi:predicted RNA-binding protein YlxR (DUF448 family)